MMNANPRINHWECVDRLSRMRRNMQIQNKTKWIPVISQLELIRWLKDFGYRKEEFLSVNLWRKVWLMTLIIKRTSAAAFTGSSGDRGLKSEGADPVDIAWVTKASNWKGWQEVKSKVYYLTTRTTQLCETWLMPTTQLRDIWDWTGLNTTNHQYCINDQSVNNAEQMRVPRVNFKFQSPVEPYFWNATLQPSTYCGEEVVK